MSYIPPYRITDKMLLFVADIILIKEFLICYCFAKAYYSF